jgi:hypothetical protein
VGDVTIGQNAAISLGTVGNLTDSGTLAASTTQSVILQDGGTLAGNGTVAAGALVVNQGTVSPGFSIGHLDVQGNYEQSSDGALIIDVEGASGNLTSDTVDVTGEVQLGGKLVLDASQLVNATPGTSIQILTSGEGIVAGTEFDSVITTGSDDIYFYVDYSGGAVNATAGLLGDFTHDDAVTAADADLFAIGLINPNRFFDLVFADAGYAADIDDNNRLDFDDIDDFAALLPSGGNSLDIVMAAIERQRAFVPEPSATSLTLAGGLCFRCFFRRRYETAS